MNLYKLKKHWENLFLSFTSIFRVFFLSKRGTLKYTQQSKESELVILGNGPSLSDFLDNQLNFLYGRDVLCVNYFGRTEEYSLIKPKYYVIVSPQYFEGEEKESFLKDRMRTFELIKEQTTWKMELIVPVLARKHKSWQSIINQNSNIKISYFNSVPVEGYDTLKFNAFKKGKGMPRPHNVLIPSLLVSINKGYKKIFMTGTDHSWLQEIFVTEFNEVLLSQKHFYDFKKLKEKSVFSHEKPQPMFVGGSNEKRKLHEVLEKFYLSFRAYWEIEEYAKTKEVEIINLVKNSYIDAFSKY